MAQLSSTSAGSSANRVANAVCRPSPDTTGAADAEPSASASPWEPFDDNDNSSVRPGDGTAAAGPELPVTSMPVATTATTRPTTDVRKRIPDMEKV